MMDPDHPGVRLSRSKLQAVAQIRVPGHQWQGMVEDLSLSGVLVQRPDGFDPGLAARAVIDLLVGEGGSLRVQVRLVRCTGAVIAYVFEGLGPSQERHLTELIRRQGALKDGVI